MGIPESTRINRGLQTNYVFERYEWDELPSSIGSHRFN